MPHVIQATLDAEHPFCPPLHVAGWCPQHGQRPFDLAIWGAFSGTITVQISYDGGASWIDTGDTYSRSVVDHGGTATPCHIRCGFKPGDHRDGRAFVRIAQ